MRRRQDAAPSGIFRVIYRYDSMGRSFLVQEERPAGSNQWFAVSRQTNLPTAIRLYPDASISELAQTRQYDLELRFHEFARDNDYSRWCWHCGQDFTWQHHRASPLLEEIRARHAPVAGGPA